MPPGERREQLLDVVLRVIVTQGVHKVSMDSVAKEAGVTRPVVYAHFTDRDDLLRASLAREEAAALKQMAAIMPEPGRGTPARAVIASLAGFLAAVQEAPDRWRAIFTLVDSSTPVFRARLEQGRAAVLAAFEDVIRAGNPEPGTDVEVLARALHALFWDAGRLVLAEPETFPPDRILRFARDAVERHLRS
ncbi:TetR family transcriptional regulator [Actinomadura rayongensis]|uniref:TetR family transcriptional regulator n=2 Tax=Actinomadura rayongensis TaxID=1429076 RepID=A0A6I4W7N9_9ACTN|nr:TetR family transcriptional regulator [Actinomadura rayongensis]